MLHYHYLKGVAVWEKTVIVPLAAFSQSEREIRRYGPVLSFNFRDENVNHARCAQNRVLVANTS
jgi:hypothetical protein